jgi:hypothetical protein
MLRKAVILLIVLNLVWWVWARNWLAWVGLPSTPTGRPEVLMRQLRPEALRVQPLPPGTPILKTIPAPAPTPANETAPDAGD